MFLGFRLTADRNVGRAELLASASTLVTTAVHADSGITVAVLGRLFASPGNSGPASDAERVLHRYLHRGRAALEALEGEFSLTIHDPAAARWTLMRDPLGNWPLYWTARNGISVATQLLDLVTADSTVNREYLAEYLMSPGSVVELATEATAIEGIRRVLPGTIVEIDARGARTTRYWDWHSRIPTNVPHDLEQVGEQLWCLLSQAVADQTRGRRTTAHLSGGLDSSSVVAATQRLSDVDAAAPEVTTLSLVYEHCSLEGERAYIESVLARYPHLRPRLIPADRLLNFDWFSSAGVPDHDEPYGGLRDLAIQRALIDVAAESGAEVVLTGMGSDELFACPCAEMSRQAQRGRLGAAWREVSHIARTRNISHWRLLRNDVLPQLLSSVGIVSSRRARWPHIRPCDVPDWIRPAFAKQFQLRQRGRFHAGNAAATSSPLDRDLRGVNSAAGDWVRWNLAAPRGAVMCHPFRDPRVIAFALGVPVKLREQASMSKPVLQTATRGVLPELVRLRQGKRGFDIAYGLGMSRSLRRLEQMLAESSIHELALLDTPRLIQAMRAAAHGLGGPMANERIDKTLALVAWFDRLTGFRKRLLAPRCSGASRVRLSCGNVS